MSKEVTKEDFKEAAQELVKSIRITRAFINEEQPGAGDLMVEAVFEELQSLVPRKAQSAEANCENATCDNQVCGNCACEGAVGMTSGMRWKQ